MEEHYLLIMKVIIRLHISSYGMGENKYEYDRIGMNGRIDTTHNSFENKSI